MSSNHFLNLHANLYHMAWEFSWPSIVQHGLLSTEALLDLYGYTGSERERILTKRRPESVLINSPTFGCAVIRDQKPISDKKLSRCLSHGMTTSDWYACLNRRVFFWTTKARLFRLMSASAYRNKKHCVLELDAKLLLQDYCSTVEFSPINSGATFVDGPMRGAETFSNINSFPYSEYRKRGRRLDDIYVELTVDYAVRDILKYTKSVTIMQADTVIETVYSI